MEGMFKQLLPIAIECGISHWEFWDLTFGEISLLIKVRNKREKQRLQEAAAFNYSLAHLIGLSVARLMDKNAKYPPIHEAFPNLFDDVDLTPKKQDWRIAKERLMRYAEAHNKKRGAANDSR